jgi:hypothetical protein
MLIVMYVSLLGFLVLLVAFRKHKLQAVEADLREQLSRVRSARDASPLKLWIHFDAQANALERLLHKHFYKED